MGRLYSATINLTAAATQRDIFEIVASSTRPVALHEFLVTTDIETDANEVQIQAKLARRTGAFTSGSGGSTVNGHPLGGANTAVDAATVETGNTTQITGGTEQILGHYWINNRIGIHVIFTPETRPHLAGSNGVALGLLAAPASTAFAGHVIYEELV